MTKQITAEMLLNINYTPISVIPPSVSIARGSAIDTDGLGKIPGVQSREGWIGYNWRKHIPTIEDVKTWDASGANIGILATNTPAFDIDVDDANLAEIIKQEILRVCGCAPIRIGRPPRFLLIYRSDLPFKKRKLEFTYQDKGHAVELLGDGQQFVIAGIHPQGHHYSIDNIIPHNELKLLTSELISKTFDAVQHVIESNGGRLKKSATINDALSATLSKKVVDLSDEEISEHINQLDPDMPYDEWIKVGMALHGQYGGTQHGFLKWDIWSRKGSKYVSGETKEKWKSFKATDAGVSFKSVIQMVQNLKTVTSVSSPQATNMAETNSKAIRIVRKPKSVAALMKAKFEPRTWVMEGILPEGCSLLAAHPKMGKSWLALQLCKSVTTGAEMFGRKVIKGKALYLALEDDDLRLQSRLRKLNIETTGDVNMLSYDTEWNRDGLGGVEDIDGWLQDNSDTKLVVIDTLEKFRMQRKHNANGYGEDYQAFSSLKSLSKKHRVATLVIHHLKKGAAKSDDILEGISGTMGHSAAVDTLMVLDRQRDSNTARLHFTGRDVSEEKPLALSFDKITCLWNCEGYADQVFMADSRRKIMEAAKNLKGTFKAKDIEWETSLPSGTIRGVLRNMTLEGSLIRPDRGSYALPQERTEEIDPLGFDEDVPVSAEAIQQYNKQTHNPEVRI